jgi:hypothetical protein
MGGRSSASRRWPRQGRPRMSATSIAALAGWGPVRASDTSIRLCANGTDRRSPTLQGRRRLLRPELWWRRSVSSLRHVTPRGRPRVCSRNSGTADTAEHQSQGKVVMLTQVRQMGLQHSSALLAGRASPAPAVALRVAESVGPVRRCRRSPINRALGGVSSATHRRKLIE